MNRGYPVFCGVACGLVLLAAGLWINQQQTRTAAEIAARIAKVELDVVNTKLYWDEQIEGNLNHTKTMTTKSLEGTQVCDDAKALYPNDTNDSPRIMKHCRPNYYNHQQTCNETAQLAFREIEQKTTALAASKKKADDDAHPKQFVWLLFQVSAMGTLYSCDYLLHMHMGIVKADDRSAVRPNGRLWFIYMVFAIGVPVWTFWSRSTYLDWLQAPGCLNTFSIRDLSMTRDRVLMFVYSGYAFKGDMLGVRQMVYAASTIALTIYDPEMVLGWTGTTPACTSTFDICILCNFIVAIAILVWASSYNVHAVLYLQDKYNKFNQSPPQQTPQHQQQPPLRLRWPFPTLPRVVSAQSTDDNETYVPVDGDEKSSFFMNQYVPVSAADAPTDVQHRVSSSSLRVQKAFDSERRVALPFNSMAMPAQRPIQNGYDNTERSNKLFYDTTGRGTPIRTKSVMRTAAPTLFDGEDSDSE